ncbi:GNAT family N-acetyltransferase [uncultured Cetobacterium sp.]|uniref:GNAT family N-acetyltransferase n=1 Tax=uncultured Cetobacterium sp. TaxID=527638 RepID=UPI002638F41A|nr:GNAT family N-acetyltransferase [uncultured Cetobacterium sp.]
MQMYILNKTDKLLLEEIANLEKKIFTESYYSIEVLKDILKSEDYRILVVKNEEIKGYLIIHDSYDIFEIMKIAVKEEYRNSGVAEKLVQFYLELEEKNLFLEVREGNIVAQNFYKKLKFKVVGKRKNYYSNGESAILMLLERN